MIITLPLVSSLSLHEKEICEASSVLVAWRSAIPPSLAAHVSTAIAEDCAALGRQVIRESTQRAAQHRVLLLDLLRAALDVPAAFLRCNVRFRLLRALFQVSLVAGSLASHFAQFLLGLQDFRGLGGLGQLRA